MLCELTDHMCCGTHDEHMQLYHPNLDYTGGVCISLRKDWTCILDTNNIVYRLINLFVAPNPMDPLNTGTRNVAPTRH